jgi:succinyl-CoA synthetase alpha subunit
VGGRTFLAALSALGEDQNTKVLVLVSKPGDPTVERDILARLQRIGKPAVVAFVGGQPGVVTPKEVIHAETLAGAAEAAVALAHAEPWTARGLPSVEVVHHEWIAEQRQHSLRGQRFVRGLYSGGTLADEAALLLGQRLSGVAALTAMPGVAALSDPQQSVGHAVIDLGEDIFTRGRPHPMIDPTLRIDRLQREAQDPEVAVLLFDVVLGYGAHKDPAGALNPLIRKAKADRNRLGGHLTVIASVVGTEGDPQGYVQQRTMLEEAGVRVAESNAEAALLAAAVVTGNR